MTVTCTLHCSGCDSHFSSLAAFDAHRKGDYSAPDSRYCEEPADDVRFIALSTGGRCDLQRPIPDHAVPVYTLRAGLDGARARLGRKRASTVLPEAEAA